MKLMVLTLLALAPRVYAFPEFARHGYTNCVTCHVSPTGGGILNGYGRAIAKEVLSHGSFFWEDRMNLEPTEPGPAPAPKPHVDFGGDARALQMIDDSPKETKGQFVFMQADLEAAFTDGKRLIADGTIGRAEPGPGDARNKLGDWLVSRRHWLGLKLGPDGAEDRFQVRFGRFFPAYGINIAEHTTVTRSQLGFDQQQETYNAEAAYVTETWNAFATYVAGRPDNPARTQEKGVALQLSRSVGESNRVGANVYYGKDPNRAGRPVRRMAGAFGLFGLSEKLYALTDMSLTYDQVNHTGVAEFVRLGWEFSQGVHFVVEQETGKVSLDAPRTYVEGYSLGLNYFPRVHWEFDFSAGLDRNTSMSRDFDNVLLLLAHYYL